MKNQYHFFIICLFSLVFFACNAQHATSNSEDTQNEGETSTVTSRSTLADGNEITVGFYNVENLFDTKDDPQKEDEDFLPEGKYAWTKGKYDQKVKNIAKVLSKMGDEDGPEITGLVEVECKNVLEDLISSPALAEKGLKFVHEESSDNRGIDVAFVYDPSVFTYDSHQSYRPEFPSEPSYTSRDVLRVSGSFGKGNAVHFIVNHWPSRRGGAAETESRRMALAKLVNSIIGEIRSSDANADIILMGDFNDDPNDKSIKNGLKAVSNPDIVTGPGLYNPMAAMHLPDSVGTLTYKGKWNLFDQIIMSNSVVSGSNNCQYVPGSAKVYNPEFIQVGFGKGKDYPKRAIFRGEFVPDGFSDHFPVYMKVRIKS